MAMVNEVKIMKIIIIDYLRAPYDGTEKSAIELALQDIHMWTMFYPDDFIILTRPTDTTKDRDQD